MGLRIHGEPPTDEAPRFTEATARTLIRALLVDYEHVVLEELDRSFGIG